MIIHYTISAFITQLIFIGCRTWNVKSIAQGNINQVLLSGALVHMSWLVSITIGVVSMHEVMTDFNWRYLPVVGASLTGGLLGSYWSMKR